MGWGEGGEGQEEWVDCHNSVPFHLVKLQLACSTCSDREDHTKKSEQQKNRPREYLNAWNRPPIKYLNIAIKITYKGGG